MKPYAMAVGASAVPLVMAAIFLRTPPSIAGSIVGTLHDLGGLGWSPDYQVCIFCHTPHNANTPQLAPLWNHMSTTAVFAIYGSASLHATPGQPAGVSKACLSCHDVHDYANYDFLRMSDAVSALCLNCHVK